MKKFIYKLWAKVLTIIGDIKWFKWPMWLLYDPSIAEINGKDITKIMSVI